ncbi:hypothetical protein PF010_g20675 [Phytophthora fragariae]|uniref:Uncharacterized protein n=2 Tax=Phytophthora TaxID=4783 RepID=A0A6A3QRL6_9STRA|nr:hypothetical protein PF009_g12174 [Phytophthora fragariae]KAE9021089.1 hypothetical protein PR002_g12346 [Phytophthora rubi]KAE8994142.1 hypothetical protein PF011_g16841 [Phytophthora fragariae]KAE9036973.1 hypothetical protein PR001_g8585 [Phytophthora rubi]KAE9081907.1 hypothetical protein PF007_g22485 [Phytophthora fragariae]
MSRSPFFAAVVMTFQAISSFSSSFCSKRRTTSTCACSEAAAMAVSSVCHIPSLSSAPQYSYM